MTLSAMPERHPVIDEPPYAEQGVRKLSAENYSVLRILYSRRKWQSILPVCNAEQLRHCSR